MNIKKKQLIRLLNFIDIQSVYITDDYHAEMREEYDKKSIKKTEKLVRKLRQKAES